MSHKTHMNDGRESYSDVVPMRRLNEGTGGPKEVAEERSPTEENAEQLN